MRAWVGSLLVGLGGHAQADIYKCVRDGHVTYSNVQAKGCALVIASPREAPPPVSSAPAKAASPKDAGTGGAGGFPKVSAGTQRARDDERRRILDAELSAERTALADAQQKIQGRQGTPAEQQGWRDRAAMHERNIEALNKEIANLR